MQLLFVPLTVVRQNRIWIFFLCLGESGFCYKALRGILQYWICRRQGLAQPGEWSCGTNTESIPCSTNERGTDFTEYRRLLEELQSSCRRAAKVHTAVPKAQTAGWTFWAR